MNKLMWIIVTTLILLSACKKEQGPAGPSSLINITSLVPGVQCENGGISIESGLDINNNKVLESSEITDVQNVCNGTAGAAGHTSLIRTSALSSNEICLNGGLQIQTGVDINDNGVLEDSEVQQTQQICNGANGSYDKQIAIVITGLGIGAGANGTTPYIVDGQTVKFNIDNFPDIDSAVFVVNKARVYTPGSNINVKLFNVTDNIAFDNSLVTTGSLDRVTLYSSNIFSDLPKKEIDLGIQTYMDRNDTFGDLYNSYLVLYRK